MSGDILQQMFVTAANGEMVLFPDYSRKADAEGKREEYEIARLDNLARLGVVGYEAGPVRVTGVSVERG